MISLLSDLLRMSLDNTGFQEVTLKEEMEFLKTYLEIQKIRFQKRLKIQMDIAPETLDALVPNLSLQPLVENAIKHGVSPRKSGGEVGIQTRRAGGYLQVHIWDTGKGFQKKGSDMKAGIGIQNTKERLLQLYEDDHRFVLDNGDNGGARVMMEIPFRVRESKKAKS